MKLNLKELRKARALTQEDMAEALGISVSLYNGIETGKRRINATYLEDAAKFFDIRIADLIDEPSPTVAIAGHVGAGARVPLVDAYEKGDGPQVERPAMLGSRSVVAVEVEGDSMEPHYREGDVLFYCRDTVSVPNEAIGRICVCEDADGMAWVKTVKRGSQPGQYHLESVNPRTETMWDVKLHWAAPVVLHVPADMARKI